MKPCDKKALRRAIRQAFPGDAERMRQSECICGHVLAWGDYQKAGMIGGYMPMGHEADITGILLDALKCGKNLALPRCGTPPAMTFHRVNSLDELVPGAYGLMEPKADAPLVSPAEVDLLLVPLEAVDSHGMRLGKGGGYYDRLLSEYEINTLGVALEHQVVQALDTDAWDRPLKAAVTCRGVECFELERTV